MLQRIVELFTARGLERSEALQTELKRWLDGELAAPERIRPERPPGMMARWSPAELQLVRVYLRSMAPDDFTLEDWGMLVDYLVQRHLPPDDLRTEAQWLATRAAIMGRVAAAAKAPPTVDLADTVVASLARPEGEARALDSLSPPVRAAITFGRARACENVQAVSDAVRRRMRTLVVDHAEALALGDRTRAAESVESKLLDAFGTLNRDWRRIAVTEATENLGQGFVASCTPGTRIRRVEQYRGACAFCRSIDGSVLTVVDAAKPDKNGETEVWVGKTNVGRSASPRRRGEEGDLVDRPPHERWWLAAGAMHPHCRGRWVKSTAATPDPTFEAWLASLKGART